MAAPALEVKFAIEHSPRPGVLVLEMAPDPDRPGPAPLELVESGTGARHVVAGESIDGCWRYRVPVPGSPGPAADDELRFRGGYAIAGDVREVALVVRRTSCRIGTALVERGEGVPLWPQTRAAILWHAWGRFQEVCALKRFTSGLSGSDVFVFRPRLSDPGTAALPAPSWGSYLLVKTGHADALRGEWERFRRHLVDRAHPFMARSEALLDVRPGAPGPPDGGATEPDDGRRDRDRVTLVGSFLGGELLEIESFESVLRGPTDAARGRAMVDKLASVLAPWHAGSGIGPLGAWERVYRNAEGGPLLSGPPWPGLRRGPDGDWFDGPAAGAEKLYLFDGCDLETDAGRAAYSGVAWDIYFHDTAHFQNQLLGKRGARDGLLYRLMALPVRYSLTHGDLHPRNVLVGRDDVWLLDFGETGPGPTLYDYTKLEVYLRLWCLDLSQTSGDFDDAASRFEAALLDHMTGSEGGVEHVGELADALGARPRDLRKVASCIGRIRRRAVAAGTGPPDRRDYLAVLYLTVLETLRYAGREPARVGNFRLLTALGWRLEDNLSRIVGLAPHKRRRLPFDHRELVTAAWLAPPGAPGRVRYALDRADGREALAPLAATRGLLQNPTHHLDVFDHTLLVLANLEAIIYSDDPVGTLFDPAAVDRVAEGALRKQGLSFPPPFEGAGPPAPAPTGPEVAIWDDARALVREWLDDETRLVLKWAALFHDVGKPATRGLNRSTKRGRRVQFIGHELYGPQLVAGHLKLYFPDKALRDRVDYLIRRHHAHHDWGTDFRKNKPAVLEQLVGAAHVAAIEPDDLNYLCKMWEPDVTPHAGEFLSLLFHGYADILAGRGLDASSVPNVTRVDRAVLRFYALYMKARETCAPRFGQMLAQPAVADLARQDPTLVGRLRTWFIRETAYRAHLDKKPTEGGDRKSATRDEEPTEAAFLKKAKQMTVRGANG